MYQNDYIASKLSEYIGICYSYAGQAHQENIVLTHNPMNSICDWLDLCANLLSVDIDHNRFDDTDLYCKIAWDAEEDRSKVLSGFFPDLLKFQFAINALEILTRVIVKDDDRGYIRHLCDYLAKGDIDEKTFNNYPVILEKFVLRISQIKQFSIDLSNIGFNNQHMRADKPFLCEATQGIYIAYKIRCNFAHGSMQLPYAVDPEDDELDMIDSNLLKDTTTIVLMTIAMLLYCDADDQSELDELLFSENNLGIREYLVSLFR